MNKSEAQEWFLEVLQAEVQKFEGLLIDAKGDWVVKGFIDVYKKIYTISDDTKVVSKLIELMLFPYFESLSAQFDLKIMPCREQNHYPDLTFIHKEGWKFAVDLKSTYRRGGNKASGMTLGAFTGYFRNRETIKSTTFPYGEFVGHYVVGVIYSRNRIEADEFRTWTVPELERIPSVVKNLIFFAQPKYRIARDTPGSGNTKNIGAIDSIEGLISGKGPFSALGEEIFDDYWMNYLTKDMARAVELPNPPYMNLNTYKAYKNLK